jgi:hypothetical protein
MYLKTKTVLPPVIKIFYNPSGKFLNFLEGGTDREWGDLKKHDIY